MIASTLVFAVAAAAQAQEPTFPERPGEREFIVDQARLISEPTGRRSGSSAGSC